MTARPTRLAAWMALAMAGLLWAGLAAAHPKVPLPPHTHSAAVAKRIVYNGLQMHARVFGSRQSQQQVVDFYKQRWGKQAKITGFHGTKIVGHVEDGCFITVQVKPDGAGSKGTIGMLKLLARDTRRPQLGKGLPQPANSQVVNDITYPDDRTPARTVLLVDKLSPDQNADYFRSRLLANGWKDANVNECSVGAGHCVMQFQRGHSRMMFVAERVRGRSQVLMNILDPAKE